MTPEELQAERDNCTYFTQSREGGYVFKPEKDFGLEFVDHCNKSAVVFLPVRRWNDVIGDNRIAHLFDPITKYDITSSGRIGLLNGCEIYTDAFISPQARECDIPAEVVFVPRTESLEAAQQRVRENQQHLHALHRAECMYYTESRENSYSLKAKPENFVDAFIDHCTKSKSAFLNTRHWYDVLSYKDFAALFDPNITFETVQNGYLGKLAGCELYTNAFIPASARIGYDSEDVVFVPRE